MWMVSFVGWFLGTRVGRWCLAAIGLLAAIGAALAKVYSAGKAVQQAKQDRQSLDALRTRAQIEDDVARLPANERASRLKEWSRD